MGAQGRHRLSGAGRGASVSLKEDLTDGCCDHRALHPDEDSHRHSIENLDRADAPKPVDLRLVSRLEFGSGAVAMRYEPRR